MGMILTAEPVSNLMDKGHAILAVLLCSSRHRVSPNMDSVALIMSVADHYIRWELGITAHHIPIRKIIGVDASDAWEDVDV
jgi:hypothetical protein